MQSLDSCRPFGHRSALNDITFMCNSTTNSTTQIYLTGQEQNGNWANSFAVSWLQGWLLRWNVSGNSGTKSELQILHVLWSTIQQTSIINPSSPNCSTRWLDQFFREYKNFLGVNRENTMWK